MDASTDGLPLISIVVPSLNQGRFLGEALDSIVGQAYPRLEIVVMDGGSTDESVSIIRGFTSRLTYWQSGPDAGQAAAINDGVRRCTGKIVAWLNADDLYCEGALWTVGRAYATFPERGLYMGNGYVQRGARRTPFWTRPLALNRQALVNGLDYILQPSTFFLREAWEAVHGLNPDLHYCMDWDVVMRIASRYPAVLINHFLAVNREHEATKTARGKMSRAIEIVRTAQSHSGQEITLGSLFYLVETLLDATDEAWLEVRHHLYEAMNGVRAELAHVYGSDDLLPASGDAQDSVYPPVRSPADITCSRASDASSQRGTASRRSRANLYWIRAEQAYRRRHYVHAAGNLACATVLLPALVRRRVQAAASRLTKRIWRSA